MKRLLRKYWAVVAAGACLATAIAVAGVLVYGDSGQHETLQPAPRPLAELSGAELSRFLPNAADLPPGWIAQQDSAHPGFSELVGNDSRSSCARRPDQISAQTPAVSSRAQGLQAGGEGRSSKVSMALARGNSGAELADRTLRWVTDCVNFTMFYGGTGLCQADLHPEVLPALTVGSVTATRIKIHSTNFHCLRGGTEPDSFQIVSTAQVGGLTLIAHSDNRSDLGEPLLTLTLQRLQSYPTPTLSPAAALGSDGPAFMVLAPNLAQTPAAGRWFLEQRTGPTPRETIHPMATQPASCEPFPFPGGYGLPADPSQFTLIGSIHALRYATGPTNSALQGDAQGQYYREPPGTDIMATARTWANRCQQYQILGGQPCQTQPQVQVHTLPTDQYRADDALRLSITTSNWCGTGSTRNTVVTLIRERGIVFVTKAPDTDTAAAWLLKTAIGNLRRA